MNRVSAKAHVRVPATSANLGAGFDCIGVAVDRWLAASVETGDDAGRDGEAITITRNGTLAALPVDAKDDGLYVGFAAACAAAGCPLPNELSFQVGSEIPIARGLGSSSAALVAGARLANEALELGLGTRTVAELCTRIEGHPDNVAPALFGGAILGVPQGDGASWLFAPLPVHPNVAFVFVIPPYPVNTEEARRILPSEVTHEIAVRAAGKAAALAHGLATGDAALLRAALDDVLHVPYRRDLVPGLADLNDAACSAGAYGVTLSGSGSTVVALSSQDAAEGVAVAIRERWNSAGVTADSFVQRRPAKVD